MDIFALALKLTTSGEAEMTGALANVRSQGQQTADTLGNDLTGAWDGVIEKVTALISIWAAADLFKHMIEEAGQLAIKLNVFSQATGISVEKLAELGEQAELAFVPVDTLQMAFRRLAMATSDSASRGAQAIKAMGIDVDSFGGDAEKTFEAIATKLSTYRDDLHKSALVTSIFGRNPAILALLNNFKKTQEEVKDLGQTMTEAQQGTMLDMEHSFVRLKIVSDGFARQIAAEAAPALKALADAFTVSIRDGEQFNVVAETITFTIRVLGTAVLLVKDTFILLGHFIGNWSAIIVDSLPIVKSFGTILMDIATQNWGRLATDVAVSLSTIKGDFAQLNHDILQDAMTTADELKNLWGLGGSPAAKTGGGAKPSAPVVKPPKDDTAKQALKDFLEEQKAEIEAMKAGYELKLKLEEDSTDAVEDKYAKIKTMDAAYLEEVGSIYGFESAQYLDQLKTMEEHHQKYLDEKKKAEEQYAKDLLAIEGKGFEDNQRLAQYQVEMSRRFAKLTTDSIESIFKAGFEKGGTISSAMQAFGKTVLKGIGSLMSQMGQTYLTYGSIMDSLSSLLPDPFTAGPAALAIGLALIALGSALGGIASGGGGGGGYGGGPIGAPSSVNFGSTISLGGNNAATGTGSLTPVSPTNVTIIGPNDPTAQRQIVELITNAQRR